jgi:hypothetical protein
MKLKIVQILAGLALWVSLSVNAQDLRDPTMPPPESSAGPAGTVASPLGVDGMTVIVRNGKSYLVVGTRLYAPGQKVGPLRVERITETEVWLRDGQELRKVPRFSGIQRRAVAAAPACTRNGAPDANSTKPSKIKGKAAPKTVPCDGSQS